LNKKVGNLVNTKSDRPPPQERIVNPRLSLAEIR